MSLYHFNDKGRSMTQRRIRVSTENKSNTSSEIKDLWQTPLELFRELDKEFLFDVDVAASDLNHLCERYFTKVDDALTTEWGFVNWCNPPYSETKKWIDKAIQQHSYGKTVVMLVPSDTSTKWFKDAFDTCNEVRFIYGRLSFINSETQKPVNGNNKGSVLLIWHARCPLSLKQVTLINRDDFYRGDDE